MQERLPECCPAISEGDVSTTSHPFLPVGQHHQVCPTINLSSHRREGLQRLIQGTRDESRSGDVTGWFVPVHLDRSSAPPIRTAGPRRVDQNAARHLGGYGKELSALLPVDAFHVYQAKVDFVHQSRRPGRAPGTLIPHVMPRQRWNRRAPVPPAAPGSSVLTGRAV